MNDIHFEAILAKNEIARAIINKELTSYDNSAKWVIKRLIEIEKYIGTANQPTIKELIKDE